MVSSVPPCHRVELTGSRCASYGAGLTSSFREQEGTLQPWRRTLAIELRRDGLGGGAGGGRGQGMGDGDELVTSLEHAHKGRASKRSLSEHHASCSPRFASGSDHLCTLVPRSHGLKHRRDGSLSLLADRSVVQAQSAHAIDPVRRRFHRFWLQAFTSDLYRHVRKRHSMR